jgi:hypothetical protein
MRERKLSQVETLKFFLAMDVALDLKMTRERNALSQNERHVNLVSSLRVRTRHARMWRIIRRHA